jgi:hypothetical protein
VLCGHENVSPSQKFVPYYWLWTYWSRNCQHGVILHTRQLEMERIMFVFFWSESPSLYMCIQQLWKCDSSYAGYCTNRTGSHTSHQIGVGIEFLSLLLWDCELTWPCLHSCKAGVIPFLFLSCADSSFFILVSAILCFFVSSSLDTSNKISLCWLVLVVEEDAFR